MTVVLVTVTGCTIGGSAAGEEPGNTYESTTCDNGGSCDTQPDTTALDVPSAESTCGGDHFASQPVVPNVMVVFDRSASMDDPLGPTDAWGTPGRVKFDVARDVLNRIVTGFGSRIRFGLSLFPGCPAPMTCYYGEVCPRNVACYEDCLPCGSSCPNSAQLSRRCPEAQMCTTQPIGIHIADGSTAEVKAEIDRIQTCMCATPIGATLAGLRGYAPFSDQQHPGYVLLMTDGDETCDGDPAAELRWLRENQQVQSFVVGFGSAVNAQSLSSMAQAGGTASATGSSYYQADDEASLLQAFQSIASSVVSCTFALEQAPPDPKKLTVNVNGTRVTRNKADGWTYDEAGQTLTLQGAACDAFKSPAGAQVDVIYGCVDPEVTLY